jgi:methionine sulfoxide reductase heme-binding subunit
VSPATLLPFAAAGPSAYWYLTRATGIVSLLLLTAVVVLGVLGASGAQGSARWPRFAVADMHRDISLVAIVVLALHIVTTLLDPFAPITLLDAVIPFRSTYRPLWLGFGALAFDLVIALTVTSLIRRRLGYATWRAIHWLAYASWPVAVLHGLGTGSDSKQAWALALTFLCVVAVAVAVVVRIVRTEAISEVGRSLAVVASIGSVLLIGIFTILGPLAPGWAKRAGTPSTLLASSRVRVAVTPTAARVHTTPVPLPFDARLSGTIKQSQAVGGAVIDMSMALHGGPAPGQLRIRLAGAPDGGGGLSMTGSQVDLLLHGQSVVMQGQLTQLQGQQLEARVTGGSPSPMYLVITLNINNLSGTVNGTMHVQGAP